MKKYSILAFVAILLFTSFCKKEHKRYNDLLKTTKDYPDTSNISLKELEQKSCFSIPFLINDSLFIYDLIKL